MIVFRLALALVTAVVFAVAKLLQGIVFLVESFAEPEQGDP